MGVRYQTAAFGGIEVQRTESFDQLEENRTALTRTPAGNEHRFSRRPQRIDSRCDGGRVGQQPRPRFRCEVFVALKHGGDFATQGINRKLHVGGTRFATFSERARQRCVQFERYQCRVAHGPRVTRDGPYDVGVCDVLQRAAVLLRLRHAPGQHEQRYARDVRVRDAGQAVGDAGSCSDQRDADATGQLGVCMRHMHRSPLVAYVDDADAFRIDPHPQRHDMSAAQAEHAVDTACLQEAGSDGCDRIVRNRGSVHAGFPLAVSSRPWHGQPRETAPGRNA